MSDEKRKRPECDDVTAERWDWLEGFYLEHRQVLFTLALSVTRCPERAEDAVHEAFYKLYRLNSSVAITRGYIFRAVRNSGH